MKIDDLAAQLYDGIGLLTRRLRQAPGPTDLTISERSALSRLDRGGPASTAELARAEQITPQGMATTLAVLEQRGLIDRAPDPHDGRRVIMSLSAAGAELLRHRRDARTRQFARTLAEQFTPAELDTLAKAAPLLTRLAESS